MARGRTPERATTPLFRAHPSQPRMIGSGGRKGGHRTYKNGRKYTLSGQSENVAVSWGVAVRSRIGRSSVACALHDAGDGVLAEPQFPTDQAITASLGNQRQHLGHQPV